MAMRGLFRLGTGNCTATRQQPDMPRPPRATYIAERAHGEVTAPSRSPPLEGRACSFRGTDGELVTKQPFEDLAGGVARDGVGEHGLAGLLVAGEASGAVVEDGLFVESGSSGDDDGERRFAPARRWLGRDAASASYDTAHSGSSPVPPTRSHNRTDAATRGGAPTAVNAAPNTTDAASLLVNW